jgi:hypothetical protein
MQYIVLKPFTFAGDQYKSGQVFDPAKYPVVCDSRKLARLVSTRRLVEDFKLPSSFAAEYAETSHEDGESAQEKGNVKRSKAAE